MNIHIKSKQPNCVTCKKPMQEWDPWANYHEHIGCASSRIANEIIESIRRDLEKIQTK